MDWGRLYGQIDKNVFGGNLPGGAARPGREVPRMAGDVKVPLPAKKPEAAPQPVSGRGAGRTTFRQEAERTPLERAPIGQVMTLGGVKGFKNSKGEWQAGSPDAAAVEASPQGVIPVPTFGTGGYAAAGYLKSLAGPLGRPFKILKNDDQVAFENRTKEVGRQSDGNVVFNRDTAKAAGKEGEYNELGEDLGNKVLGRYTTKKGVDGSDIASDEYDTNRSVGYHWDKIVSGDSSLGDRVSSAIALPHRALDDIGWTNASPYGTQQVVGTPGAVMSKPDADQPSRIIDPVTEPATAYAVQAGDTLTSIAAKRGSTVAELVKRNNIANPDMISVGQMIR